MRVYLTNLGCKLNQAELEAVGRQLHVDGHEVTSSLDRADVQLVNTCTVTHVAARTSRKIARRGARRKPGIRTVLTGCYVSGSPEEAAALAGVDLVVPNRDKDRLLELLYQRFPQWRPAATESDIPEPGIPMADIPVPYVPLAFGNSRALIKIEDGCNMRCSFCIIPITRGAQTSRPLTEVLQQVDALVEAGHRELVITGVQISSYRWHEVRLYDLVSAVLETTDIERVRLTSIAPWDFDQRLLDLVEEGRVCRHFHLSLQSGSARTLGAMRRPYTPDHYRRLASRMRARVPGLAITTDVIVGFPGESDDDFRASLEFVEELEFARIHAFPYSRRPGTAAADLPGQIDPRTTRERMQQMLQVATTSQRRFQRSQLGKTVAVLWESRRDGAWVGTSDNYLRVEMDSEAPIDARITDTRIESLTELGVAGRALGTTGRRRRPVVAERALAPHPTAV